MVLTGIGEAELALGRPAASLAPLERALAFRSAHAGDSVERADTEFALARALAATVTTVVESARAARAARARTLATSARDAYAKAALRGTPGLQEVDAWLAGAR
jgi:hypothetical protein